MCGMKDVSHSFGLSRWGTMEPFAELPEAAWWSRLTTWSMRLASPSSGEKTYFICR